MPVKLPTGSGTRASISSRRFQDKISEVPRTDPLTPGPSDPWRDSAAGDSGAEWHESDSSIESAVARLGPGGPLGAGGVPGERQASTPRAESRRRGVGRALG